MQTSIFMRGANSSQVLVLVDGMKVTDEFSNATPLQNIPIGQVDHIEILRGNASALYGPRAMGGVIQIFTKSGGNTSGPYGSVSYGSRNTKNVTGGYSQKFNDTLFNISLNHQETGGFATKNSAQNDGSVLNGFSVANPTKNAYNSNSVSMNLSKVIIPGQEIGIKILGSKFDIFSDAGFDYGAIREPDFTPDGVNGMNKLRSNNISSQLFMKNQINDFWNSTMTYGVSNMINRNDYNFNQSNIRIGSYQTSQKDFSWLNDFVINNNQTLLLGLQSNQIKTKDEDTFFSIAKFEGSRVINSLLAGYTGKFDAIGLQLNIRHDNTNKGEDATTGLSGLSYDINPQWKWAGNISNAFSAPTSPQLHNIGSGGNPNLKPEESNSMETSLQYMDSKKTLRVVLFDRETTNLIEATGARVGCCSNVLKNTAKSANNGVEISGQAILDSFIFKVSATFQDPINKATNNQLQRRAENFGSFEIGYAFDKYKIGSQAFFSSSTPDLPVTDLCPASTPLCRTNAGYAIANLYGSYTYDKNWSASLNIENLFDKTYQKNYGFNTPGFGAFLSVQYSPEIK